MARSRQLQRLREMSGMLEIEIRNRHLGAFMRPVSIHTAAWRYPGGLERSRFNALFMADHLAVLNMPMQALKRSATVTSFDPLTLLPALAVVTEHMGLIATASTTYNEPYHWRGNSLRSTISAAAEPAGTW
jgi:hypothetical protein